MKKNKDNVLVLQHQIVINSIAVLVHAPAAIKDILCLIINVLLVLLINVPPIHQDVLAVVAPLDIFYLITNVVHQYFLLYIWLQLRLHCMSNRFYFEWRVEINHIY